MHAIRKAIGPAIVQAAGTAPEIKELPTGSPPRALAVAVLCNTITAVSGGGMRLSVRNTWVYLDAVEKAAVMLAFVALTLAAWVLGTMIVP